MDSKTDEQQDEKQNEIIDNGHQKAVSGKNQKGPIEKVGKGAGGNAGSKGQNFRADTQKGKSVGSHKPGGDGPGTKKFKHDSDARGRGGLSGD